MESLRGTPRPGRARPCAEDEPENRGRKAGEAQEGEGGVPRPGACPQPPRAVGMDREQNREMESVSQYNSDNVKLSICSE